MTYCTYCGFQKGGVLCGTSNPEACAKAVSYPTERAMAEAYTARDCTLNGVPARVTGRLNRFATIAALDGSRSVEYAWRTVGHVLAHGGHFRG